MDQPITSELIEAINIYKKREGISDYKFSQLVNTTPTSFSRWMNFKAEYIQSKYAVFILSSQKRGEPWRTKQLGRDDRSPSRITDNVKVWIQILID